MTRAGRESALRSLLAGVVPSPGPAAAFCAGLEYATAVAHGSALRDRYVEQGLGALADRAGRDLDALVGAGLLERGAREQTPSQRAFRGLGQDARAEEHCYLPGTRLVALLRGEAAP